MQTEKKWEGHKYLTYDYTARSGTEIFVYTYAFIHTYIYTHMTNISKQL